AKHFRMGTMLAKDTVARRLQSDGGLSCTECSYQVLQGIDYLALHRPPGASPRYGGNAPWGTRLAGVALVHTLEATEVHALTSPSAFHQFWLNAADADVVNYLRFFTFRTREEIAELERATEEASHQRAAQKLLADDLTTMVHGEQATSQAKAAAAVLFGRGDVRELDGPTLQAVARELPGATVAPTTVLIDAFIDAGITASKGAARRDADGGGLSVNG